MTTKARNGHRPSNRGDPARRVLFLSHGGGPLPLLGDPGHREMVAFLDHLRPLLGRPDAILIASAHWETSPPAVTGGAAPRLIYDYYGFPEASYHIQYPAPGHPELAERLVQALERGGLDAELDPARGFDHGLFVPLKLLFPEADIPCLQIALDGGLDPEQHLRMGQALAQFPVENVLILGSGFSFHNMAGFFGPANAALDRANRDFESWLETTLTNGDLTEGERWRRLVEWEMAPGARACHPREEHLLPLHLCYGAGAGPPQAAYSMEILGKRASAFLW